LEADPEVLGFPSPNFLNVEKCWQFYILVKTVMTKIPKNIYILNVKMMRVFSIHIGKYLKMLDPLMNLGFSNKFELGAENIDKFNRYYMHHKYTCQGFLEVIDLVKNRCVCVCENIKNTKNKI